MVLDDYYMYISWYFQVFLSNKKKYIIVFHQSYL